MKNATRSRACLAHAEPLNLPVPAILSLGAIDGVDPTIIPRVQMNDKEGLRRQTTRAGETVDVVVLSIALMLIPVWLLGHLFLSFYPIPIGSEVATRSELVEQTADTQEDNREKSVPSHSGETDSNLSNEFDPAPSNPISSTADSKEEVASSGDFATEPDTNFSGNVTPAKQPAIDAALIQEIVDEKYQSHVVELKTQIEALNNRIAKTDIQLVAIREEAKLARKESNSAIIDVEPKNKPPVIEKPKVGNNEIELKTDNPLRTDLNSEENSSQASRLADSDDIADTAEIKKPIKTSSPNTEANLDPPDPPSPAELAADLESELLVFREWTSNRGSKAMLAFVRWEGDKIIFYDQKNRKHKLTLNRLSLEDQNFLLNLKN